MPKINVYLPDELAEAVKETGVPVSAVCQRALELAVRRITAMREALAGPPERLATAPAALRFTARLHGILGDAQALAATSGAPGIGTEHLLRALLAEGSSLALSVLHSMEVEPAQIRAELERRGAGEPGERAPAADPAELNFGPRAAIALELAVTESTALGNSYIGSEHLLLGLIAEPDGAGGSVLRSLGAELRLTRRAVAAALAGYFHLKAQVEGGALGQGASAPATADAVAAVIRTALQPLVTRLDALEQLVGAPPAPTE
jgi:ATP-dependent Clp protease ATP-binding subunit ClpA